MLTRYITPRFVISLLLLFNVGLSSVGVYFYYLEKDEEELRVSLEALVDRLADELVVVNENLGNARNELEETQVDLRVARDQSSLLEFKITERDQRIREMKYELAQLRFNTGRIDLGDIQVTGAERNQNTQYAVPYEPRVAAYLPQTRPQTSFVQPAFVSLEPIETVSAPMSSVQTFDVTPAVQEAVPFGPRRAPSVPIYGPIAPMAAVIPSARVMPMVSSIAIRQGAVLAVNDEFEFVIVDLGANDGVKKGMFLTLSREGERASNLRVDMVDETSCAATIMTGYQSDIQIGDPVKAQLS